MEAMETSGAEGVRVGDEMEEATVQREEAKEIEEAERKSDSDAPGQGDEGVVAEPADEDWQARAVRAETQVAELGDRLGAVEAAAVDLQRMVKEAEQSRSIERELLVAGVVDLEDARGLVEAHVADGAGVMESVMRVKERKPLLFAQGGGGVGGGGRVFGGGKVRATLVGMREEGREPGDESIASAAEVARQSGDRRMLLRYLQMRRER